MRQADAARLPFDDASFDVVTLLEVLEHIPRPEPALAEAARVAWRAVLISAPSRPDENPEHLHLFTQERLRGTLAACGVTQEFRRQVFARDGGRCVVCGAAGVDAHYIVERRLFDDGGYYLDNGATLCRESLQRRCDRITAVRKMDYAYKLHYGILIVQLYN